MHPLNTWLYWLTWHVCCWLCHISICRQLCRISFSSWMHPNRANFLLQLLCYVSCLLDPMIPSTYPCSNACSMYSECLPSLSMATGCSTWPLESRTPVCSLHRPIATSRLLHPDIDRYWVLHTLSVGAAIHIYTQATSSVIVTWQIDFSIGLLVTCATPSASPLLHNHGGYNMRNMWKACEIRQWYNNTVIIIIHYTVSVQQLTL